MRSVLAIAVLLAAACNTETARTTANETAAPGAAPVSTPAGAQASNEDTGVFVVNQGDRELYREAFQRAANRVSSTISHPAGGDRVEQVATLGEAGTVEQMTVTVYDQSGAETQRWTVAIQGESAQISGQAQGSEPQQVQVPVPANTIPVPVNESIVMTEQILRVASRLGADRQNVSVLSMREGEPEVDQVTVTFDGPQSARIAGEETAIDVVTDGQGRIVSARDESQNITIRRTTG